MQMQIFVGLQSIWGISPDSAVCFLRCGDFQGDPPSFNPLSLFTGVVPWTAGSNHLPLVTHTVSQEIADEEYYVPWSRHMLACLHSILAVDWESRSCV